MAFESLSRFRGNTFLFVGEDWPSRTTGDEAFFRLLERDWDVEDNRSKAWVPNWPGREDFLWAYHRKVQPHDYGPLIVSQCWRELFVI